MAVTGTKLTKDTEISRNVKKENRMKPGLSICPLIFHSLSLTKEISNQIEIPNRRKEITRDGITGGYPRTELMHSMSTGYWLRNKQVW